MNKHLYSIIFLLTFNICDGQNLVPNGDFEQYINCPTDENQLDSAAFWLNPGINSPDYYNSCATSSICDVPDHTWGFQIAHSGQGYGGIYLWQINATYGVREFMETPLVTPLTANTCYHFEMYVNLQNVCNYTTEDIQVYFVDHLVLGYSFYWPVPVIPQIVNNSGIVFDTLNWTLVSGNYTAVGGENHLIIGNFYPDINSTIINLNSSNHDWVYVYVDDVSLTPCTGIEEQNMNIEINIYPNPLQDIFNISVSNNELTEFILYDMASRKLLHHKFINSASIYTNDFANGIYIYEVRQKDGSIKIGKVLKE